MDKKLIKAVMDKLTLDELKDVTNHGAAGGFNGFIYYTETLAFWKKHKKAIINLIHDLAQELGETDIDLVYGFACLKDYTAHGDLTKDDIAKALYSKYDEEYTQVYNALTWFALEEVARQQTETIAA